MQAPNFDAELQRLQTLLNEKQDALRALEARRAALNISQTAGFREPNIKMTGSPEAEVDLPELMKALDLTENLPSEVLGMIFKQLDLNSRGRVAQVNRRFHDLIFSGHYALENVVVLNLFEEEVWNKNVTQSKIQCRPLAKASYLRKILPQISGCMSLKLWFKTIDFVDQVVEILKTYKFKFKCLDVYPYCLESALHSIHDSLPNVGSITLRPHGSDFFWEGLQLPVFPNFENLETLVLDSVNLNPSTNLPISLGQLEWCNRREEVFNDFLPILSGLKNLEYLLLGHVNLSIPGLLARFFETLRPENMPKLQFLVLRFAKFPQKPSEWDLCRGNDGQDTPLCGLKVLKLDLCYYTNLGETVSQLLSLTSEKTLKIVSLNCIYEDFKVEELDEVTPKLKNRQISLQLGLLQKAARKKDQKPAPADGAGPSMPLLPISCLKDVLWKVDMSFLDDNDLLLAILGSSTYWQVTEMKFVQCEALSDQVLETLIQKCPRLRKLFISRCPITPTGINSLIRDWPSRRSKHLQVIWRSDDHPASYYIKLLKDRSGVLDGLKSKFIAKDLPGESDGERIHIWERSEPEDGTKRKTMVIQDYGEQEMAGVLGFAVPLEAKSEVEDGNETDDTIS